MYIHCADKTLIKFVLYCSKNNILWAPRLLNSCTILIHIHCDKYLAFHYSFKTFLSQVVVLLIFYKLLQCCWVNWDIQIFYTISTLQSMTENKLQDYYIITLFYFKIVSFELLNLYTLTWVLIFSTLIFLRFLWYWER